MNKAKIYDEMFYKIDLVLGGKMTPKEFAEALASRIVDLECQVNSLSDMLAKQESRNDRLESLMKQQADITDRVSKLIEKELMLINNQIVFNKVVQKDLERRSQREEHTV